MKTQTLTFISAMMLFFGVINGQTTSNNEWHPVLISMDGTNGYLGVEASYSLSKCNSNDVVLLKLVNTNNYAVKAQWVNVVVTKDGKELYGNNKLVSVKLPASSEKAGDCDSKIVELTIKLSDFGVQTNNFDTFVGSNFNTIK